MRDEDAWWLVAPEWPPPRVELPADEVDAIFADDDVDDERWGSEPEPAAEEPDLFDAVAASGPAPGPAERDDGLFEPAAAVPAPADGIPDLDEDDWWLDGDDEDPFFVPLDPEAEGAHRTRARGTRPSSVRRLLVVAGAALAILVILLVVLAGGDDDRAVRTAEKPTTTRSQATTTTAPPTTTTTLAAVPDTTVVETTEPTAPTAPSNTARASNTRPRTAVATTNPPDGPAAFGMPPTDPPPPPTTQPPPTTTLPMPTGAISVSPSSIATGYASGAVVLSWSSSDATSVSVNGPGVDADTPWGFLVLCPSGDDPCSAAAGDYTYTLTVTNATGAQQYTATLTIDPAPEP